MNVFNKVETPRPKMSKGAFQERDVRFKVVQAILYHNIDALFQIRVRPKITNALLVTLVAIEGLDPMVLKQNFTVDVGPVYKCVRKEFAPTTKGPSWRAIHSHCRGDLWIVSAQTQLKDPKWFISQAV